jgi:hypothetical protein
MVALMVYLPSGSAAPLSVQAQLVPLTVAVPVRSTVVPSAAKTCTLTLSPAPSAAGRPPV